MNARTRKLMTLVAVVLTFCLCSLEQATSAQSPNSNCKQVKGSLAVNFGPGVANGTITNGGVLNGTIATTFNAGSVVPTADPAAVSFTGSSTITTNGGTIVTHEVYVFDFVRSWTTAMLRIDSAASTGAFAGATGVIFLNSNSASPESGQGELAGQICYANE